MRWVASLSIAWILCVAPALAAIARSSFVLFESDPVRPLALAADGEHLYALNIPDGRLEIFAVAASGLTHLRSVPVGLEPVAVAARSDAEVWVVNHLSDSVSIIDVGADPPRVVRTLLVGDEPRDIVFAGPNRDRAFITTAHRGQNSPVSPDLDTPGLGRADVWVFAADSPGSAVSGTPLTVLTLFGDTPRALAVSPDGNTVYAAVFKSGNQTTTVSAFSVCDGGETALPCLVQGREMPGGLPGPNGDADGLPQPRTGLIVKHDNASGSWQDPLGRDWRNAVPVDLPDKDVFAIDAAADPPREVEAFRGVGTVIYAMATSPVDGRLYVAASEARNEVRFEPNVRSRLHESRVTIIDDQGVRPRHLNKHIDYAVVPSAPGTKERSLALPIALAVSTDGSQVWIAALGSNRIAVLAAEELANDSFELAPESFIDIVDGGPAGLVLDEEHQRAYVLTRFDNGIASIDIGTHRETGRVLLHTAEPPGVRAGRRFLYDADYTSSNGEAACASCHVSGGDDALAWDLGEPQRVLLTNPNPINPFRSIDPRLGPFFNDFHPLKGPMTTQPLRGLAGHSPMHWRGDRSGAFHPAGDPYDDLAALRQFNGAFVSLMGRATVLAEEEMDALASFILQITPPPNPLRNLDNSLTAPQQAARDEFFRTIQGISCATCHVTDETVGRFGTDRSSSVNGQSAQLMKVPSLRQTYQKVGMFGMFPQLDGFMPSGSGDQIRGFGFLHDGATGVFIKRTFDYVMAFDSNLAPIVGQQVTLTSANATLAGPRVDLLTGRAAVGECDLTVKGVSASRSQGWYRLASGRFQSDLASHALDDEALRRLALVSGQELTYTCVPPGSGLRLGVDRDEDGYFDGDEVRAASDPADASSTPAPTPVESETPSPTVTHTPTVTFSPPPTFTPIVAACTGDCDGGGTITAAEIRRGIDLALRASAALPCAAFDHDHDGRVTIDEIVQAIDAVPRGCSARP